MIHTIKHTLTTAAQTLNDSDSPRIDAEVLLRHVLHCSRTHLIAYAEQALTDTQYQDFQQLLQQRQAGVPIAYLVGEREFWSLPLRVTEATLIPRADTELIVELALQRLPTTGTATVFDLGTGSGAIALAIAHECPHCHVIASDRSPEALAVAQHNAQQLQLTQVQFRQGDWFQAFHDEQAHLIVSNPPYIAPDDPHLQQGDVRYEPHTALVAETEGLDDLRQIIQHAPAHLQPQGWLLVEHGYQQATAVQTLFTAAHFQQVETYQDLNGQDRVTVGQRP